LFGRIHNWRRSKSMYNVDEKDQVVQLVDVPQSDSGAPMPLVFSDEGRVVLAYYGMEGSPKWNDFPRILGHVGGNDPVALLRFIGCSSYMFGEPNDEALTGHPLASRGLKPYGVFRIKDSSWIRSLERSNSVSPLHEQESYQDLQHLIFTFHDTTFECLCDTFDVRTARGSIGALTQMMLKLLFSDRTTNPPPARPLGEVISP
jgi:hypothetical protein